MFRRSLLVVALAYAEFRFAPRDTGVVERARGLASPIVVAWPDELWEQTAWSLGIRYLLVNSSTEVYDLHAAGFDVIYAPTLTRDPTKSFPSTCVVGDISFFPAASPVAAAVLSYWVDDLSAAVDQARRVWGIDDLCSDHLEEEAQEEDSEWRLFMDEERWEATWFRHLLSEVDVRETKIRDPIQALWTALETDRGILVLNTHDHAVTSALGDIERASALLMTHRVGLVLIDEGHAFPDTFAERFAFVLRIGFAPDGDPSDVARQRARAYERRELVVPLGAPAMGNAPISEIQERRYGWGYAGRVQSPARAAALKSFLHVSDASRTPYVLHVTAGLEEEGLRSWEEGSVWSLAGNQTSWREGRRRAVDPRSYQGMLRDVVFVPSPAGTSTECYRTYEALEAGAIPVVATSYYHRWFDAPFPVVDGAWTHDSVRNLFSLLRDPAKLEDLAAQCQEWWSRLKASLPNQVRDLIYSQQIPADEEEQTTPRRKCHASENVTMHVYANELPMEVSFPVGADSQELDRVARDFALTRGLRLGAGCEDIDCVVKELVQFMRQTIQQQCPPRILVTGLPGGGGVDQVAAFLATTANLPVATRAGRHRRVIGECPALEEEAGDDCVTPDGLIMTSYAPFRASESSSCEVDPPTFVVHVVRDPRQIATQQGLVALTHRWAAHHEHWHAEDVLLVRYEDLLHSPKGLRDLVDAIPGLPRARDIADEWWHCLENETVVSVPLLPPVFDAILDRYGYK